MAAPKAVRGEVWVVAAAAATRAAATFSGKILAPNEEGRGRDGEGRREGCVARSQEGSARRTPSGAVRGDPPFGRRTRNKDVTAQPTDRYIHKRAGSPPTLKHVPSEGDSPVHT